MNPYLLTLAFLTLFSLMTTSEMHCFLSTTLESQLHNSYRQTKQLTEKIREKSYLEDAKAHTPDSEIIEYKEPKEKKASSSKPKRSSSLKFNFARPPNNSRLNLYLLYEESFVYEAAAALMRQLYRGHAFFEQVPQAEYQILDRIKQAEEGRDFLYPDALCGIDFGNKTLQEIFFLMFKGSASSLEPSGYPSLLHYITFDKTGSHKINLMFAPHEIIEVLFPHVASSILKAREEIWEQIFYEEKHRQELPQTSGRLVFKKRFKDSVEEIFRQAGLDFTSYKKILDFSLGKQGNILLVADATTGITIREKIPYHEVLHSKKQG